MNDPIIFKKKIITVVLTICILLQLVVLVVAFADEEVNEVIRKVDSTMNVNDPVYSLFKRKRCAMCHAVDHKLVGPPFRAISIRYKDADDTQIRTLAKTVMYGGIRNWGEVPMPANSVTLSEAELLVRWILRLSHGEL
tara:strand:+ start:1202 stop:1615 length:414 start_codon:yes stop_codon:yes gene_type:complete